MQTAPTAGQLGANIDATQQSFNKALTQKPTVGGTSAEYEKAAVQTGLPAVPAPTTEERDDDTDDGKLMRKYMDFLDEAPIQAVNPNDPNAAAFGKKINAPAQATPQVAATQTPTAQPAAHVVDPNRKYGGGYDPTKVQYASTSSNPTQPNPAPVKQNTATSANMGGYAQSAQPNPTPPAKLAGGTTSQQTNNQSSGYTAQSQAQNTTAATNAAAPTFTGMAGNTQPTTAQSGLAGQYVSANQPQAATTAATQPTSDVLATQALQSQDQGVAGTSKGIPAAFGQVAEDDEDDVDLKRIRELIRK